MPPFSSCKIFLALKLKFPPQKIQSTESRLLPSTFLAPCTVVPCTPAGFHGPQPRAPRAGSHHLASFVGAASLIPWETRNGNRGFRLIDAPSAHLLPFLRLPPGRSGETQCVCLCVCVRELFPAALGTDALPTAFKHESRAKHQGPIGIMPWNFHAGAETSSASDVRVVQGESATLACAQAS